jgi:hypothetical protein
VGIGRDCYEALTKSWAARGGSASAVLLCSNAANYVTA